jgi:hypothetical protein
MKTRAKTPADGEVEELRDHGGREPHFCPPCEVVVAGVGGCSMALQVLRPPRVRRCASLVAETSPNAAEWVGNEEVGKAKYGAGPLRLFTVAAACR